MRAMAMVKSVAVAAGRNRSFVRRYPPELGGARFRASTEGSLKLLQRDPRNFDPTLLGLARQLVTRGSVVWDIGVNVGVFTFAAAGLAGAQGQVVAVDADTWCVELARRSAALNKGRDVATVRVLPVAVSDRVGVASFEIAARSRAVNHLSATTGSPFAGGSRETQFVPTTTLDAMLADFPAPDLVKIDVEGAELLALAGATRLLREIRPTLILEVEDDTVDAVDAVFARNNYAFATRPSGGRTSYTLAALPH